MVATHLYDRGCLQTNARQGSLLALAWASVLMLAGLVVLILGEGDYESNISRLIWLA